MYVEIVPEEGFYIGTALHSPTQNSPCKRAAKIDIGPRSALSAGFIMN
jgi:hypothetical protein